MHEWKNGWRTPWDDSHSRPDSYPVESLSSIPNLNNGESARFYYTFKEYTPGLYVALIYQSDGTGDYYYFVFAME